MAEHVKIARRLKSLNKINDLPSEEQTMDSIPNAWEMSFLNKTEMGEIGTQLSGRSEDLTKNPDVSSNVRVRERITKMNAF